MSVRENVCKSIAVLVSREESKVAFANKIGVSKQTLNNWLQGKNAPDIETVAKVSQLYGVSFEGILKGDVSDNPSENSHTSTLRDDRRLAPQGVRKALNEPDELSVQEWAIIDSYRNLDKEHQELVGSLLEVFERDSRRGKS